MQTKAELSLLAGFINIKAQKKYEPKRTQDVSQHNWFKFKEIQMQFFTEIKKWLAEITEIALLLIALGVAVEILFGNTVPFFGQVITNITGILKVLGENGLVGLVALGIILYLFNKRKATN
ncbi:MAG: hypothetical protein WBL85_09115 [Sedimentisphaerales bacterium]